MSAGLVPVAALLLFGGKVGVDGIVVSETRGGEAPVVAYDAPTLSFVQVVTPIVALRLDPEHDLELHLDYGPRIFWRASEGVAPTRPLVLHVGNLKLDARMSPSTSGSLIGNVSYGAADYTYLPKILPTSQSALPQSTEFLSVTAAATAQVRASPRWTLLSTLDGTHHHPLTVAETGVPGVLSTLPRQTLLHAAMSASARATRTDDVVMSAGFTYQTISGVGTAVNGLGAGRFEALSIAPQVGWRSRLTPLSELTMSGGLVYNQVFAIPSGQGVNPVAPTASAVLTVHALERREFALRATGGLTVDYYVDPILGTTGSRGVVNGGILVALPPDWLIGLEAVFGTTLSLQQLPDQNAGTPEAYRPDETTAAISLPVRHRLSPSAIVEVGGRWSDRAPRLVAPDFAFHQRQLWLYVSLTFTTIPVPRWFVP